MTPCWCQRKKVRSFCWCLASLPCARRWSDEPYLLAAPRLARPRNDADWRTMRPASALSQDVGQRHRGGVGDRPARCLGEIRRWLHAGQLRRFDQRGEECRPARPALRASLVMILAAYSKLRMAAIMLCGATETLACRVLLNEPNCTR